MKTKCLIVDDEPLALEVIESYLHNLENIEIVAKCHNAVQAFEILTLKKVDLIFLDVQMPQISGISFLKTLTNPPKVIITTAYRDYALDGYELDIVDYLLKPISFERFLKALNKFYQLAANNNIVQLSDNPSGLQDEFIYVKSNKKLLKVSLDEILFVESMKDYVIIHTYSKKIIIQSPISHLAEKLPSDKFVRIHRSFIVSIKKISSITTSSIEVGSKELPVGRNYKNGVIKTLVSGNKVL